MYFQELEKVGLTAREIRVYLALLEIGTSSVGNIIKHSGIPGSKIYETLNKLGKRGLVSNILKGKKMSFTASNPKNILEFIDSERNKIAETIIPQLERLQTNKKEDRQGTIYEGINGIKAVYEMMLKINHGETIYVLGAPIQAQEKLEAFFIDFNKKRIKRGVKMKIIYNSDAEVYGKVREKMELTEVRYMKKEDTSPAWIDIFGDKVAIFDFSDVPSAVLIKAEAIAKSFLNYFNISWRNSGK